MNPRSLSAKIRAIVAGYKAGGGIMPVIHVKGDEIIVHERGETEALTEEAGKLQSQMEDAFGGAKR
jgi:hypothetical protein